VSAPPIRQASMADQQRDELQDEELQDAPAQGEADDDDGEPERMDLSVQIDNRSACERHITVTIPRDDIQRYIEKAFTEMMPTAEVPGFRAGRAPRKLVESRFRKDVAEQVKGSLLMDSVGQVTEDEMRALGDRKEELYRALIQEDPPIVDGAVGITRALHAAGVRLAVGSSGPRANIDLVLNAMGIGEYISVVVSGDDVTRGKPDPQVFSLAANRLGIHPRRCVVIEDAPNGVEAAHAAGARCIAVTNSVPGERLSAAERIVDDLAVVGVDDLLAILEPTT